MPATANAKKPKARAPKAKAVEVYEDDEDYEDDDLDEGFEDDDYDFEAEDEEVLNLTPTAPKKLDVPDQPVMICGRKYVARFPKSTVWLRAAGIEYMDAEDPALFNELFEMTEAWRTGAFSEKDANSIARRLNASDDELDWGQWVEAIINLNAHFSPYAKEAGIFVGEQLAEAARKMEKRGLSKKQKGRLNQRRAR